jgi:hypothetical protein
MELSVENDFSLTFQRFQEPRKRKKKCTIQHDSLVRNGKCKHPLAGAEVLILH